MKQSLLYFLLLTSLHTIGQEPTDTIPTQQLHEIVIEAPKVVRMADKDVYHPSESALKASKNGMQLLGNLMIPSLSVNDALDSVKAAGETVQIRINGKQATISQVRALLPETVKRVEWIDNPGMRYNGASYVLNLVVVNPTFGGSLMASAQPALSTAWGRCFADLKFNIGRSQWTVGGNYKLTNKMKGHRDYTETFTFADGTSLTRDEIPQGGSLDNTWANAWTSYSYIKPDTTVLIIDFNLSQNIREKTTYEGLMKLSDGSDDILLTDTKGSKGSDPRISAYWQQNFQNRQMLAVNFSSSFYAGRSFSDYIEQRPDSPELLNDISTSIRDRNQAYSVEANYVKRWDKSNLTVGASYVAKLNRSEYENFDGQVFHQRQDGVYFFAEYFRRFGKWSATAGMGAHYTRFLFKESGKGQDGWNPRPQATVTYSLNDRHQFRLNFTSWQSAPSLEETNVVPQQLDGFQWRVGNQNLKTSSSYMLTFRYGFSIPRADGSFGIRAFTSPNAITPLLRWDGDRLLTTYENSQGLRNLTVFLAPQVEVIPDWLTASGYLEFRMEDMKGSGYKLTNNQWCGNASVRLSHWGFTLSGEYERARRSLWGEKISWGEDVTFIDLSYDWKKWQFSAGVIMPFGKYDHGSKSLSKWNTNEQHMRIKMRIPYIQISYNLQWGRQRKGAKKLINSGANTDRSSAGGR